MKNNETYENVFEQNGRLFERTFNTKTSRINLREVRNFIQPIYIPSNLESINEGEATNFKDAMFKNPLNEINFKKSKDRREKIEELESLQIPIYGNNKRAYDYISKEYPNAKDFPSTHFHMWYLDIETAVIDDKLLSKIEVEKGIVQIKQNHKINDDYITNIIINGKEINLYKVDRYIMETFVKTEEMDLKITIFEGLIFIKGHSSVDLSIEYFLKSQRDDWKTNSQLRSSTAKISLIQIKDDKNDTFYVYGLNRDYKNRAKYKPKNGKVIFKRYDSEEEMLKAFLWLLRDRNPSIIAGFNSFFYDFPYITHRVIRVLDKIDENELYIYDKDNECFVFNEGLLKVPFLKKDERYQYGFSPKTPYSISYAHKLGALEKIASDSIFGRVSYRNTQGLFNNSQNEFLWNGYMLFDYYDLYKKYAFKSLDNFKLDTIAKEEKLDGKVQHSAFLNDFKAFWLGDESKFSFEKAKDDEFSRLESVYITIQQKQNKLMDYPWLDALHNLELEQLNILFIDESFDLFVEYGIVDVELLEELEAKLGFIALSISIGYITSVNADNTFKTVNHWNAYTNKEYRRLGDMMLPLKSYFDDPIDSYFMVKAIDTLKDIIVKKLSYNLNSKKGSYRANSETISYLIEFMKETFNVDFVKKDEYFYLYKSRLKIDDSLELFVLV